MNILIADDEKIITDLISDSLLGNGNSVTITNDNTKVLDLINENIFDLVILDMFFPNQQGIEKLKQIGILNVDDNDILKIEINESSTTLEKLFYSMIW